MRPEFRYFKSALDIEPIKSLDEQWRKERKQRNKQLNAIFNTIPFYECWLGDETSILGILCSMNNREFEKIKDDKTYKFEMLKNEKVVITGNKRNKAGKAFNAKIQEIRSILNNYLPFNEFMLNKLKLTCWVFGQYKAYVSVCGVTSNHFIVSIPVKSEGYHGDKFPLIPEYLTEIKQSEFLMLQGK
ncbi:DUF5420 family protein [Aggregatibacter actinomycetemcomitans]|uniref:DUF5420 family protein n=1 Tax=Aggregatibacter actinomycetemcomitans TaxID=714 RepID=UPI00023FFC92|nr:DUF5420 family protein [Aggregatibacter actinomycetemcomitans]EHK90556.1 hypothetical protein RHAA1_05118 [Aggregatibacter actinomycetemcomitans RhAA1]KNE77609.1 hypothetical protein RHAA2_05190 [Aggregatibacter actinomycetemcomitans RhAA1]MBN6077283.1 DUF5420 family protein [Aggregatibacter actinomycetemcomitans]MBN6080044.1 DUF5420 family protein [Aggregatibacter actinomycetemcomitans]